MKLFNMINCLGMPVKHFQYSEPVSKNSLPLSNPLVMTLQSPVLQYSTDHHDACNSNPARLLHSDHLHVSMSSHARS